MTTLTVESLDNMTSIKKKMYQFFLKQ